MWRREGGTIDVVENFIAIYVGSDGGFPWKVVVFGELYLKMSGGRRQRVVVGLGRGTRICGSK